MTLEYWNSLANQIILISSLLCGFSLTIVANLIISDKSNDKVLNRLLKTATIASGCFLVTVFAMTRVLMATVPRGYLKKVTENDFLFPRMIGTISFIIGVFSLSFLISLSGWTKSKKVGIFTTLVGIVAILLILFTMIDIRV
jgi:hypothetical protein